MNSNISLPIKKIDNEPWIILKQLGSRFIIRAMDIKVSKKRVPDPSGHHLAQATAKTSVKICPRGWDISQIKFK